MKSALAAFLTGFVLPYGVTSGQRIVIDGINGTITFYNSANQVALVLTSVGGQIIGYNPTDGSTITFNGGTGAEILFAPKNVIGQTFDPGSIITSVVSDGISSAASMTMTSPVKSGGGHVAYVQVTGASPSQSKSFVVTSSDEHDVFADTVAFQSFLAAFTSVTVDGLHPLLLAGISEKTTDEPASGTITTTETVVDTVTITAQAGVTYDVEWDANFGSTVAGDYAQLRLREDATTAGASLGLTRLSLPRLIDPFAGRLVRSWTAGASGSKSFCGTLVRAVGTGNMTRYGAGSNGPARLRVVRRT